MAFSEDLSIILVKNAVEAKCSLGIFFKIVKVPKDLEPSFAMGNMSEAQRYV